MQDAFNEENETGFDLMKFVRVLLSIIPQNTEETLYLIICLIELFNAIKDDSKSVQTITYRDFLNYITEVHFIKIEFFYYFKFRKRISIIIKSYSIKNVFQF